MGVHSTITNSFCPMARRRDKLSPALGSLPVSVGSYGRRDLTPPSGVWIPSLLEPLEGPMQARAEARDWGATLDTQLGLSFPWSRCSSIP